MLFGELLDRSSAHTLLCAAAEHGVSAWDTAEMYPVPQRAGTQGRSEELLGDWLAQQARDRHIITTKVAGPGGMEWLRGGPLRLDSGNIRSAIQGSLRRLRTDYIDVFLLHWPDRCAATLRATRPCRLYQHLNSAAAGGRTLRRHLLLRVAVACLYLLTACACVQVCANVR